jgi:hypothetical protein
MSPISKKKKLLRILESYMSAAGVTPADASVGVHVVVGGPAVSKFMMLEASLLLLASLMLL